MYTKLTRLLIVCFIFVFYIIPIYGYCENVNLDVSGDMFCNSTINILLHDNKHFTDKKGYKFDCATYNDIFDDNGCWNNETYKKTELHLPENLFLIDNSGIELYKNNDHHVWKVGCKKEGAYKISVTLSNETSFCTKTLHLNLKKQGGNKGKMKRFWLFLNKLLPPSRRFY